MLTTGRACATGRGAPPSCSAAPPTTGSAIATYNLGVLALNGVAGTATEAFGHFATAAELGEPRGYRPAALLLDQGARPSRAIPTPPPTSSCAASPPTTARPMAGSTGDRPRPCQPDTIRAMQTRLQSAGFYDGAIDGMSGPRLRAALTAWRKGGFLMAGG